MREVGQDPFHLRYHIALIGQTDLTADFWTNNVPGASEVRDHRYDAGCEGLKDYGRAKVANRWKQHHIRQL